MERNRIIFTASFLLFAFLFQQSASVLNININIELLKFNKTKTKNANYRTKSYLIKWETNKKDNKNKEETKRNNPIQNYK